MTAQLEFYCSAREEEQLFTYLQATGDLVGIPPTLHDPSDLRYLDLNERPGWPAPCDVLLWKRSLGQLRWYGEAPVVEGVTHEEFVHRLFAREEWDELAPGPDEALLDFDLSPVLYYRRSLVRGGQVGPCLLLSGAANAERVSHEFAKWMNRCFSWIRRHSTRVHGPENMNPALPNPYSICNSIYAFPDALSEIEGGKHPYVVRLW